MLGPLRFGNLADGLDGNLLMSNKMMKRITREVVDFGEQLPPLRFSSKNLLFHDFVKQSK